MNTVNQNVHFTNSPSQPEETELKAELHKTLENLKKQPTIGVKILQFLLKGKSLTQLEYSEKGFYWWLSLVSNPVLQVGICFWNPTIADSRRHDHYQSIAFVIPLVGKISHKLLHISGNKFFIFKQEELQELSVGFVPSFMSHRIENRSNSLAISVHVYLPLRPAVELVIDED